MPPKWAKCATLSNAKPATPKNNSNAAYIATNMRAGIINGTNKMPILASGNNHPNANNMPNNAPDAPTVTWLANTISFNLMASKAVASAIFPPENILLNGTNASPEFSAIALLNAIVMSCRSIIQVNSCMMPAPMPVTK